MRAIGDTHAQLRQLPFWSHLRESEQQLFLQRARHVHYSAGENVRGRHTACLGVLQVVQGILRTYMLAEDGREVTVYRLKPGDICMFSASCILDAVSFDVEIDAEEDSDVLLIPIDAFEQVSSNNLHVENFSYKMAAERLSDVLLAVERMLFLSLEERLAAFLIDETAESGSAEVHMTQERIARAIGSAREAVSRSLRRMAQNGEVELFRGGVRVLDKNALYKRLAGG